jgi:uncharacterized glyoxalase superfamily protein PhnB
LHAVTPYLVVPGVARLIDFMKHAFGGEEMDRMVQPDGRVMHASVRIADSVIMMGEPMPGMEAMPAALLLYVTDCDAVFRRAVDAGAMVVNEPTNQFYGDRSGGVKDPSGNMWWISTHVEDVAPEELKRRAQAAVQQRSSAA